MPAQERVAVLRTIKTTFKAGSSRGQGTLHDVSVGGVFVRSPLLPPDGSDIKLVFETPSRRSIRIEGVVRWNTVPLAGRRVTSGFGVELKNIDNDFACFVAGALSTAPPAQE